MEKPKKGKTILIVLLSIVTVVLIAGYAVFSHYYLLMKSPAPTPLPTPATAVSVTARETPPPTPEPTPTPDPNDPLARADVYHLLLLGSDSLYDNYVTRTDTMMMATIRKDKKQIILTSFLRDSYVYIPDNGFQRLNAANVYGGPDLLLETLSYNFGVEADNYLFVNFYSFMDAVDAMGGVDIELDDVEIYYINLFTERNELGHKDPPVYHLDGQQLLAFCRNRSIGSDTRRTSQQRRAVEALWEKAKGMPLRQISDAAEIVLSRIVTDMDQLTFLSLLARLPALKDYEIIQQQIPADGTFQYVSRGASVLEVDFDANREILQELYYGQ